MAVAVEVIAASLLRDETTVGSTYVMLAGPPQAIVVQRERTIAPPLAACEVAGMAVIFKAVPFVPAIVEPDGAGVVTHRDVEVEGTVVCGDVVTIAERLVFGMFEIFTGSLPVVTGPLLSGVPVETC